MDLGAARIQTWLARTSRLTLRRGASHLLETVTNPDRLLQAVGAQEVAQRNPHAPRASGVVHLEVDLPTDATGEARLSALVTALLLELRREAPALEWQASWAAAQSYGEARPLLERARASGQFPQTLPALAEFPAVRRCDECNLSQVVTRIALAGGERARVCSDCLARHEAAGRATDEGRRPGVETRLLDERKEGPAPDIPDNFSDLAARGEDTQVALVFADGNRIGRFIQEVGDVSYASEALDLATWGALGDALYEDGRPVPVIPHLVGGDDLLVSVPARWVWPFVRSFLGGFSKQVSEVVEGPLPSMSAGIVVCHHSHPFLDQVLHADDLLKAAKAHSRGASASVAYADLTSDASGRVVRLRLEELELAAGRLAELAALPRSARSVWQAALDREAVARRGGKLELFRALQAVMSVDDALLLARWWPVRQQVLA